MIEVKNLTIKEAREYYKNGIITIVKNKRIYLGVGENE